MSKKELGPMDFLRKATAAEACGTLYAYAMGGTGGCHCPVDAQDQCAVAECPRRMDEACFRGEVDRFVKSAATFADQAAAQYITANVADALPMVDVEEGEPVVRSRYRDGMATSGVRLLDLIIEYGDAIATYRSDLRRSISAEHAAVIERFWEEICAIRGDIEKVTGVDL